MSLPNIINNEISAFIWQFINLVKTNVYVHLYKLREWLENDYNSKYFKLWGNLDLIDNHFQLIL